MKEIGMSFYRLIKQHTMIKFHGVFFASFLMPKSSYECGITNPLFIDHACYLHCLVERWTNPDIILKPLQKNLRMLFKFKGRGGEELGYISFELLAKLQNSIVNSFYEK